MGKLDFYSDLLYSSNESAEFLRKKNLKWNKNKSNKEKIFSGEREFVSDVYHLLVEKNPDYRNSLLVDYMRPDKRENDEKAVPDLVFRSSQGRSTQDDCVVEIKVIVNKRKNGPKPYSSDLKNIDGDREQLVEHYIHFNKKIQVVAFLGEITGGEADLDYLDSLKRWLRNKYRDTNKIKMIVS